MVESNIVANRGVKRQGKWRIEHAITCKGGKIDLSGDFFVGGSVSSSSAEGIVMRGSEGKYRIDKDLKTEKAGMELNGEVTVSGQISSFGNLDVRGDLKCVKDLKVGSFGRFYSRGRDSKVEVGGNLTCLGSATMDGNITCQKNIKITGDLRLRGNVWCVGTLSVGGDLIFESEHAKINRDPWSADIPPEVRDKKTLGKAKVAGALKFDVSRASA